MDDESLTPSEYARHRGISKQQLNRLEKRGVTKRDDAGRYKRESSDESIAAARLAAQQRSPERRMRDVYAAKLLELEYKIKAKELMLRSDVENDAFRVGRFIRDSLLTLPDRLAGILAAEMVQEKVHALLSLEIRQALVALEKTHRHEG